MSGILTDSLPERWYVTRCHLPIFAGSVFYTVNDGNSRILEPQDSLLTISKRPKRTDPMTNTTSNKTRALAICTPVFLAGAIFLLGCNPVQLGGFGEISFVASSARIDDEKEDETKKEDENDLLKDMEKPLFALFVTGRQHGYIEPCGCTGLYNQKGGLMRRHRAQLILQSRGWDLVSIDTGNQINRYAQQQPLMKLRHTWTGLSKVMKYDAIGIGPDELKVSTLDLVQTIMNVIDSSMPFVCANADLLEQGDDARKQFIIVEKNGKKIGITQVLDNESLKPFANVEELSLKPMEQALTEVAGPLAECDLKVLMLHTSSVATAKQVATQFPHFDLLVHTTSAGEPEKIPTKVQSGNHTTSMIQVGTKGMYVGVVGCYEQNGKLEMKYERVPLDGRFTDSQPMSQVFTSYQNELKLLYTKGQLTDVKPIPHPSGSKYVGSEACFECHDQEFEIWEDGVDGDGGPHFVATDSIVKPPNHRGDLPRHYDPECLSCHATGWNPQEFYPYETGFISLKQQSHLTGNGCENCHGPGSEHVSIERAKGKGQKVDDAKVKSLRETVRLTVAEAKRDHCQTCHDADNSPDFLAEGAFEKYWAKIKH